MTVLSLTEYATKHAIELSSEERDAIVRAIPSLTITPTVGADGCYDLTASSWIGAFQLGDLTIEIKPKLPIERVLFLISYALDPRLWRDEEIRFEDAPSLHEAVVPAFVHHLQRAFRRGLLQGYRSEEDALLTVRGRIRFDDQIRRLFGVAPPIEVRYDDFTTDILPNRLIKAAVARLGRMRIRDDDARRGLHTFDGVLGEVGTEAYHPMAVPEVPWTRLNAHYRPAVGLARLILAGSVFEGRPGAVEASGFAVDMNRVFENFVLVALREALGLSPAAFPQGDPTLRLDRAGRVRLEPDLTWWVGRRCVFVGDVKYKRVRVDGVLHPDLYQLLAYTVASDLPGGMLVYAAGEAEAVTHHVVHLGKRLDVINLDLAGSIPNVLAQIDTVATLVRQWRTRAEVAA